MSQHRYCTQHRDRPVPVLLGWDRPIGHYFMVIEWDAPRGAATATATSGGGSEDNSILYSNLDEPRPFELTLGYFRAKLSELGIAVPDAIFTQVALDRANRTGNRDVWYEADGTFRDA